MKLDLSIYNGDFKQCRLLFQKAVFELLVNHIDIVYVFMKAFRKKLANNKAGFKEEHEEICKFLVMQNFIDKVKNEQKEQGIFKYNKILHLSL